MANRPKLCLGVKHFYISTLPLSLDVVSTELAEDQHSSNFVVGAFEKLKSIQHPNLCQYMDLEMAPHGRCFLVSEHYSTNMRKIFTNSDPNNRNWDKWEKNLQKATFYLLKALSTLSDHGIIHHNLSADTCLISIHCTESIQGEIKLSDYGVFYITKMGSLVPFIIGKPEYNAPELLSAGNGQQASSSRVDIWSLGLMLIELVNGHRLWPDKSNPAEITESVARLCGSNGENGNSMEEMQKKSLQYITKHFMNENVWENVSAPLVDLILQCLLIDPTKRKTPSRIVSHPYFEELQTKYQQNKVWVKKPFLKSSLLPDQLETLPGEKSIMHKPSHKRKSAKESPAELYHFWKLSGGQISDLTDSLRVAPSIKRLPFIIRTTDNIMDPKFRFSHDPAVLYQDSIVAIPFDVLRKHIEEFKQIDGEETKEYLINFFLMDYTEEEGSGGLPPREIREKDIDYQRHRVALFNKLFTRYPASTREILQEARIDIPPMLRGNIWAVILGIGKEIPDLYESIDKESPGSSDHQIDLDIPRCHQYHPLVSSEEGHQKMRRILKAWVAHNPGMAYWQGLDSLLAPFVTLHYNDEACAFGCLQEMVRRYLQSFFLKENSSFLQGHLLIFRQLVCYHDPELAIHLFNVDFHPELFAIPWFLTLFAHILHIDKIYRLWDRLLLEQTSFPLFLGVAIMKMLRDQLLAMDFNSCILFFSILPNIPMDRCFILGTKLNECTPLSILVRKFIVGNEPVITDPRMPWERQLTLEQMGAEFAPRISFDDIRNFSPPMVCLDIRPGEEFTQRSYSSSISVNLKETTFEDLKLYHGKHICIIGDRGDNAAKLANALTRAHFPYVSVLHGGIEAIPLQH